MTDTTTRLALPLLQPGQAQKELFHNEALALLDFAVQARVTAVGANAPPVAPALGDGWVVGTAPTGAWAGQASALAGWTAGGWRFVTPGDGFSVWDAGNGQVARWAGGAWVSGDVTAARLMIGGVEVVGTRQPAIAIPTSGTTVDGQARDAITSIIAAMRAHGLIAT